MSKAGGVCRIRFHRTLHPAPNHAYAPFQTSSPKCTNFVIRNTTRGKPCRFHLPTHTHFASLPTNKRQAVPVATCHFPATTSQLGSWSVPSPVGRYSCRLICQHAAMLRLGWPKGYSLRSSAISVGILSYAMEIEFLDIRGTVTLSTRVRCW
jgi:hypothetical protein